jgi:hypothetical protein
MYEVLHYIKYDYVVPSADKCLDGRTAVCLPPWARKLITIWDPQQFKAWLGDSFLTMPAHSFIPFAEFKWVGDTLIEYFTEIGASTKAFGDPPAPFIGPIPHVYLIDGLLTTVGGAIGTTRTGECETAVLLTPSTSDWVGAHAQYIWIISKCGDKVERVTQGKTLGGEPGYTHSITKYPENITLGSQYPPDFDEGLTTVLYHRLGAIDNGKYSSYPWVGKPGSPLWEIDMIQMYCGTGTDRSVPCQNPGGVELFKETQAAVTAGYKDWYLVHDHMYDYFWFMVQLGANDWAIREFNTNEEHIVTWYIRNGNCTGLVGTPQSVNTDWYGNPSSGLPRGNFSAPENAEFAAFVAEYSATFFSLVDSTNPSPYYDFTGPTIMSSMSFDPAVGATVSWKHGYAINSTTYEKYWITTSAEATITYPVVPQSSVSKAFATKALSFFKGYEPYDWGTVVKP